MKSGSKKTAPVRLPEIAAWQDEFLRALAGTSLAHEVTFGGGTALAAVFLHHRSSEDLDFFAVREIEQHEILPLVKALARSGIVADQSVDGPRRILVLTKGKKPVGHGQFRGAACAWIH